jgi:chaperonin GroES
MTDAAYLDDAPDVEMTAGAGGGMGRFQKAALADISPHLTPQKIAEIGGQVVDDWNRDKASNEEWREKAEAALDATPQKKNYPWEGAANVKYPLLTISSLQFAARAYPAIVKGDEAVKVKTFGKAKNQEKAARAKRVSDYMNFKLFYGVDDWEADTDAMLHRLPAIGQHFRKVYYDPISRKPCIESVSALRLTIPADAPSLRKSPRITHDFDTYPYEIRRLIQAGHYRDVTLVQEGEDSEGLRIFLEQHRLMDLDEDGVDEPYIVTVDAKTAEVLRIEEAFEEGDIKRSEPDPELDDPGAESDILAIERWCPFVGYDFIPDPKGRAYAIGFGQLLTPIMEVINTTINMQLDAGHAQVAGGGFVGAELRLQGAGKNGSLRFSPGEYKTVGASGSEIRNAFYERTFPAPSDVLFQLLGMLMDAAKDIASVNEAITGDANRNAPVGTTLALIEQGQQVFSAIYKRIYRSLRQEFKLLFDCIARYGDPEDYAKFCDMNQATPDEMIGHNGGPPMGPEQPPAPAMGQPAPQGPQPAPMPVQGAPQPPMGLLPPQGPPPRLDARAQFDADFNAEDLDIRPVSDPSSVTRMQEVARAQFVLGLVTTGQVNPKVAVRMALESGGFDNIEELMTLPPQAPPPGMMETMMAELKLKMAQAGKLESATHLDAAKTAEIAEKVNAGGAQADVDKTVAETKETMVSAFTAAAQAQFGPDTRGAQ